MRLFQAKAVDGISLLTLPRTHPACVGMNDFDWLLLKVMKEEERVKNIYIGLRLAPEDFYE